MSKFDEMRAELTRKYGKPQDTAAKEPSSSFAAMRQQLMGKYGAAPTEPVIFPRDIKKTEQPPIKQVTPSQSPTEQEDKERWYEGWVNGGGFKDGYQFGDITRTATGTAKDIRESLYEGVIGLAEPAIDTGAYLVGEVGSLFGGDKFRENVQDFIVRDIINEEKIAKGMDKLTGGAIPGGGLIAEAIMGGENSDDYSLLGQKSDSVLRSGGQLAGQGALQHFAKVPWWVTSGVSSFGGEVENAFDQGATSSEAGLSGLISAGAEILTEKISGGIKFGGKTLDDAVKPLIEKISNKAIRTAVNLGLDITGEGLEEVLSGLGSALGQKLTYASEQEFRDLYSSDDAWTDFISGVLLSGGSSGAKAVNSAINGKKAEAAQQGAESPQRGEAPTQAATPKKQETAQTEQPRTKEQEAVDFLTNAFMQAGKQTEQAKRTEPETAQRNFNEAVRDVLGMNEVDTQPKGQQQTTPEQAGEAIRDTLDNAGVKQQIQAAVDEFRKTGTVSNRAATAILSDPQAVEQLGKETGITLPETNSGKRKAVKDAVEKLSNSTGRVTPESLAEYLVSANREKAQDKSLTPEQTAAAMRETFRQAMGMNEVDAQPTEQNTGSKLYNEDGTAFESVGAAEKSFSGKAPYYDLLTDENAQRDRPGDIRAVEVPKTDAQGRYVSAFVGNSYGSAAVPDSFIPTIERLVMSGRLSHNTRHSQESLMRIAGEIQAKGIGPTISEISRESAKGVTSPDLEDAAFLLFSYYSDQPGEEAANTAAELYVAMENFAHSAGGSLVEIRNLFRRLTAQGQISAWKAKAAELARQADLSPEDVTISSTSQQEFLEAANANEMAATDAARTLNQGAETDMNAAAKSTAAQLELHAPMTPERIGDLAGKRAAESASATEQAPTEDSLYSAIMTFIRSKKNPIASRKRRNIALAALQRYYQDRSSFEAAWQQARRRAEIELGNDEKGYQILQQFLNTGGMAQDVMDTWDNRSVSRRAMREAAAETGTDFNKLIASSLQDRQAALARIQTFISENYGVSGAEAATMASQVQESFFHELAERQSRRLRALFAERGGDTSAATDNGILPAKFRQLYNLGAFDGDGFISRAALKRLFSAGGLVLSQEVLEEYGAMSEARKSAVEQKIIQEIADQLPTTMWDALNKWRHTAMLANPSTHLRNIAGTFGQFIIQHGIRDPLAAGIEAATQKISGKDTVRTKSILNPVSKADQQLAVTAWNDFTSESVSEAIKNGGRYGNAKSRIQDARHVWKINGKNGGKVKSTANKVLGAAESVADLNFKLMDAEDAIFGRTSYTLALAGYMKANHMDHITPEAREYAIKQAQQATFHDDSFLYQKVKGLSQNKLVSMAAPHVKTPTNVTARAIEYSPGSLIQSACDLLRLSKNAKTSADVINELSTGIVGTALWGVGAWLAAQGLLRISGTGSDEEREYQDRMGYEPWTLLIDGEYRDIRFLSPVCVPLMTGAAIYEAFQNFSDGVTWEEVVTALYSVADPVLSTSPASNLDGYMYAIRSMDSMTTGELLGTIGAETVETYVAQFVPALLRRAVTAEDNTERQYAGGFFSNIKAGLPGGRDDMYVKYDPWGRPFLQDASIGRKDLLGTVGRTLNISSAADVHSTEIDAEINRLLSLGYSVYPSEPKKYITLSSLDEEGNNQSVKISLTPEQWDTYNQVRGEAAYQLATQIMASRAYAAMSDEDKAALLSRAYAHADELGKQAALPDLYTANVDISGYGKDAVSSLIAGSVSDNMTDAIGGLAALWSAGRSTSGAVEALKEAEAVYKSMSIADKKAVETAATGRLKAFLTARNNGISVETFSQAYTRYYELGKQYNDESEAATYWESSLQTMVEQGKLTSGQAATLKDSLKYWQQIPAQSIGNHSEYLEAGLSTQDAMDLSWLVKGLVPETGYSSVRPVQKMEAIASADFLTEAEKIKTMQSGMTDNQIAYMDAIMEALDLNAAEYAEVYRAHLPQDKKAEEIAKYEALGYTHQEALLLYNLYNPK